MIFEHDDLVYGFGGGTDLKHISRKMTPLFGVAVVTPRTTEGAAWVHHW